MRLHIDFGEWHCVFWTLFAAWTLQDWIQCLCTVLQCLESGVSDRELFKGTLERCCLSPLSLCRQFNLGAARATKNFKYLSRSHHMNNNSDENLIFLPFKIRKSLTVRAGDYHGDCSVRARFVCWFPAPTVIANEREREIKTICLENLTIVLVLERPGWMLPLIVTGKRNLFQRDDDSKILSLSNAAKQPPFFRDKRGASSSA